MFLELYIHAFTTYMLRYTNWYVIVIVLSIVIKGLNLTSYHFQTKELKKRKEIIQEIDELREEYIEREGEQKEKPTNSLMQWMEIMQYKSYIPEEKIDEFKEKSNVVLRKYKAKPFFIVLPIFIHAFLLVWIFWYLKDVHTLSNPMFLPIMTTILTFFALVTRKRVVFSLIVAVFSYWAYTKMSGVMMIYLFSYSIILMVERIIKWIFKLGKEKEPS